MDQLILTLQKNSGLGYKESSVQVNTMGSNADDIMLSFCLTDEQAGNYDVFKAKFDAQFVKKKNVIMKGQSSNMHFQADDETVIVRGVPLQAG